MISKLRCILHHALHQPDEKNLFSLVLNLFLASMVILNIIEVVWMSIPEYGESHIRFADVSLVFFAVLFGTEYVLRIWSAPDADIVTSHAWRLRWNYIKSPMGMVDLLSFLPLIILWLVPNDLFADLRMLKLISIIRILKLTRYSDSLSMLARLYRDNQYVLLAAAMVMMILSFIAATGIYLFERYAQPELFGSIPACMWWALVTLTTVGYGDMAPITIGGKIFGVLVMISGVGVAAMPAGIFASSLVQLVREQKMARRRAIKARVRQLTGGATSQDEKILEAHSGFSRSEQREVDYLTDEFGLSFEQAVGIVGHYRH